MAGGLESRKKVPMKNGWKNLKKVCPKLLLGLVAVAFGGTAMAQNSNSTIRGQVLDPTGALVANAQVTIVNLETNQTVFDGKTDSAGQFVASQVLPGTYRLSVVAPGLKKAVINDLVASVAQVASVDVKMELGQTADVVTVEAKGEEMDRSTSDISTLISPEEVSNIPLSLRAPENLLAFIPGVAHGGAGDSLNTSQLSINGSRTLNSEILLNGVSLIVASTGTALALPSPDGLDQFRILTSNAPAEYGRTGGAVLSANALSGTNTYHGNAYLLMKNERLDANTFFNKLSNFANLGTPGYAIKKTPRDRYFQVGGSLGGAVRIPHVYNGREKTFFFVNYDRTLLKSSTLAAYTVPGYFIPGTTTLDNKQRSGDFSENTTVPIYQPGAGTPQYANNMITNLDPAAVKLMALLPLPNNAGQYDAVNHRAVGNYTIQPVLLTDNLRFIARVDEQMTKKDRLSFVVYKYRASTPLAVIYNSPLLNSNYDCNCTSSYVGSVDYTRVWNSTLVSDVNLGFFRNATFRHPPGAGLGASAALGIASLPLDETPEILTSTGASATQGAGALSNIGGDQNTRQTNITNTFPIFGTVTKTFGPHTFKTGASFRDNEFNSYNPATYPQGQLDFDGTITNHGNTGNVSTQLADLLTGKVKTGQYELPMPPNGRRNYNFGIFFQDDWKVTPKLTINAGVRYEFESPMTISNNIYSRVNESNGQLLAAGLNGVSRSLNITTAKVDVSPRFGLAYSVSEKTVIRAAFGTFYGTIFQNLGGQIAYPGFDVTQAFLNQGTAVAQPFSLSQGFPLTAVQNLKNPFGVYTNNGTTSDTAPYNITGNQFGNLSRLPLIQQYNLGFQQQLPLGLTLEVNYVGNHGVHLPSNYPVNIIPLSASDAVTTANTTKAQQDARPFPLISQFNETSDNGDSDYNALQVTVRRQFNRRLAVLSNYTFAKSMDDASTIYNFSAPNGSANAQFPGVPSFRNGDEGVSNIDVKHTLNIAMVYTTPGPWYTRGWKISPVFIGHTGLPINIQQTNEIPSAGQQRPNGSSKTLKVAPYAVGTAIQYFLPPTAANFPLTPSGPINYTPTGGVRTLIVPTNQMAGGGTLGRDSIRIPGEVDFDGSISRDFPVFRALKFNFRVDAFNIINHTNFSAPANTLAVATSAAGATLTGNTTFGRITATQPQRTLQIVGRFTF